MRDTYKTFSDRTTKPTFSTESSAGSTIGTGILYPKEREELLQAINYMKVLEDNWNGFGAKKPLTLVIEIVEQFIQNIPLNKIYPAQLSPDGEGGITLKWVMVDTKLLLNFEPGLINLAIQGKNKKPELIDGIVYNGENIIPQKILAYIPVRTKK